MTEMTYCSCELAPRPKSECNCKAQPESREARVNAVVESMSNWTKESDFPAWANAKQQQGMEEFVDALADYPMFKLTFSEIDSRYSDADSGFQVVVDWSYLSKNANSLRRCTFNVAWDYQETWNHLQEPVHEWQVVIDDETGRELNPEILFVLLFSHLDKALDSL